MMETYNATVDVIDNSDHDAAMVAKFESGTSALGQTSAQPPAVADPATADDPATEQTSKLLGKFNSVDDLAKAYTELERKLGAPVTPAVPVTPEETPAAAPEDSVAIPETTPAPLQAIMPDMQAEFAANGALSEDSYAKLAAYGLDAGIVNSYIAGLAAQRSAAETAVYQSIGGQANYTAMTAWAASTLQPAQIESFNKAVAGEPAGRDLAVLGLFAQYQSAVGKPPSLLSGGSAADTLGYSSKAQMVAAMSDPRYKKDAAYRNTVHQKLAVSFN